MLFKYDGNFTSVMLLLGIVEVKETLKLNLMFCAVFIRSLGKTVDVIFSKKIYFQGMKPFFFQFF